MALLNYFQSLWQRWLQKYSNLNFFWQKMIYILYGGLVFVFLYMLVGKFYLGTPRFLPLTWVDNNTPFLLWTFWIYVSDYLFLMVAAILCPTPKSFSKFRQAFWTVVFLHIAIFFFFPTEIQRPEIIDTSISGYIGRFIHTADGTVNCFPSLHVSLTLLSALVISQYQRRFTIPAFIWGLAIVASTLTTKQHYWYDVIGGTVVAFTIFILANRDIFFSKAQSFEQKRFELNQ